jgi:hypothetical protein
VLPNSIAHPSRRVCRCVVFWIILHLLPASFSSDQHLRQFPYPVLTRCEDWTGIVGHAICKVQCVDRPRLNPESGTCSRRLFRQLRSTRGMKTSLPLDRPKDAWGRRIPPMPSRPPPPPELMYPPGSRLEVVSGRGEMRLSLEIIRRLSPAHGTLNQRFLCRMVEQEDVKEVVALIYDPLFVPLQALQIVYPGMASFPPCSKSTASEEEVAEGCVTFHPKTYKPRAIPEPPLEPAKLVPTIPAKWKGILSEPHPLVSHVLTFGTPADSCARL